MCICVPHSIACVCSLTSHVASSCWLSSSLCENDDPSTLQTSMPCCHCYLLMHMALYIVCFSIHYYNIHIHCALSLSLSLFLQMHIHVHTLLICLSLWLSACWVAALLRFNFCCDNIMYTHWAKLCLIILRLCLCLMLQVQ